MNLTAEQILNFLECCCWKIAVVRREMLPLTEDSECEDYFGLTYHSQVSGDYEYLEAKTIRQVVEKAIRYDAWLQTEEQRLKEAHEWLKKQCQIKESAVYNPFSWRHHLKDLQRQFNQVK